MNKKVDSKQAHFVQPASTTDDTETEKTVQTEPADPNGAAEPTADFQPGKEVGGQGKAEVVKEKKYTLHTLQAFLFLVLWIIIFSAGLLCETTPERYLLAPMGVEAQLGKDGMTRLEAHFKNIGTDKQPGKSDPASAAVTKTNTDDTKINTDPSSSRKATSVETQKENIKEDESEYYPYAWRYVSDHRSSWECFWAFTTALFCFTPTNLAILTFVAGMIGGYASNIRWLTLSPEESSRLSVDDPTRLSYLREPPTSAATRGFVVYLCVIAGLYLGLDDPFRTTTSGQYVRLAGIMSVLAFTVGYDASRFATWLRIVPGPADPKAGETEDQAKTGRTNKK